MNLATHQSNAERLPIDWCPIEWVSKVQDFIDTHWRRDHILARDKDLLRWQHKLNGDPTRLSILIAQDDESIRGMLGVIPFGFCNLGQRLQGAWLTNWLSLPDERPRGLGLRLLRTVLADKYSMVGSLASNDTALRIFGALGFDIWESIPRWVRVVSASSLEGLLFGAGEEYPPETWKAWAATAQKGRRSAVGTAYRVVDWSEENARRWDRAWQQRFAPNLLGTWRDAAYLRWRYVDHPGFRYSLRFAEDTSTGDLAGLVVCRVERVRDRDQKVLRVVDFLGKGAAAAVLCGALLEVAEAAEVAFADFYCTSADHVQGLEEIGFVREEMLPGRLPGWFQPLDFCQSRLSGAFWVKPEVSGSCHSYFGSPLLHFTRSDCDQDRPN